VVSVKILLTTIFLLAVISAGVGVYVEYPKMKLETSIFNELQKNQGNPPNIIALLSKVKYMKYQITWRNITTTTTVEQNGNNYSIKIYLDNTLFDEIKFQIQNNSIVNPTETIYNRTTGQPRATRQLNATNLLQRLTGEAYSTQVAPGLTLIPPETLYPIYVMYLPHVSYNQTKSYVELAFSKLVTATFEGKKVYALQIGLRPTQIGLQFARSTWDQTEYNITLTKIHGLIVAIDTTMVNVPQGGAAALTPAHVILLKLDTTQ
jgi:hypothetical protein